MNNPILLTKIQLNAWKWIKEQPGKVNVTDTAGTLKKALGQLCKKGLVKHTKDKNFEKHLGYFEVSA